MKSKPKDIHNLYTITPLIELERKGQIAPLPPTPTPSVTRGKPHSVNPVRVDT